MFSSLFFGPQTDDIWTQTSLASNGAIRGIFPKSNDFFPQEKKISPEKAENKPCSKKENYLTRWVITPVIHLLSANL